MSLVDNGTGAGNMVMPVGPMNGANSGGMFGMGEGGFFYMLILFFFMTFFGWGNGGYGGYGGGNAIPYMMNNTTSNDLQRGFDQQAVMSGLSGIQNGLSSAEVARCQNTNNVLTAMNAGFNGLQQTITNGQFQQLQNANTIAMNLQNCCCENRAGLADLKYNIATEACSDRQAVNNGVRDILAANAANNNLLLNTINGGIQSIHDKLCQQENSVLRSENTDLRSQLNEANRRASQNEQTAQILAGQAAQTAALEQYLHPAPIPAYTVQNPNCCAGQGYGACPGSY